MEKAGGTNDDLCHPVENCVDGVGLCRIEHDLDYEGRRIECAGLDDDGQDAPVAAAHGWQRAYTLVESPSVCPDASCNEASDEKVGGQRAAEERLRPQLEGAVEDAPLREVKIVRGIVSGDCTYVPPGLASSSVCLRWERTSSAEPQ